MHRKLLTYILPMAFILAVIVAVPSMAWTPYAGEGTAYIGNMGYNLDTKNFYTLVGFGAQIVPNGYVIFHGGAANDGGEVELACTYLFRSPSGLFVGPLLAPGTDLILIESEGEPLKSYLSSGIGIIFGGTWRINADQWGLDSNAGFGFHLGVEWNSDFNDENMLESGTIIFGGIQLVL